MEEEKEKGLSEEYELDRIVEEDSEEQRNVYIKEAEGESHM